MELMLDQVQIHTRVARELVIWEESKIWGRRERECGK